MKFALTVLLLAGLLTAAVKSSEVFESETDHAVSNDHPQSIGRNRILPERSKNRQPAASAGSEKENIVPLLDQDSDDDQNVISDRGSGFSVVDRVLLALLRDALDTLEGPRCRRDLNWTLEAIERKEPWAVAMLDASAKSTSGLEQGDVFQLGHFDQCMGVGSFGQYCLANVRLEGYRLRAPISRQMTSQENSTIVVHWGVCVPASCTEGDVGRLLQMTTGSREVTIAGRGCHREVGNEEITRGEVVYASVIMFFVLMVLISTGYHVRSMYGSGLEKESTVGYVLRSFSVVENLRKLVQDSKDDHGLGCINGIKSVAMFFILGSHALLFMAGGATYNPGFHGEVSQRVLITL